MRKETEREKGQREEEEKGRGRGKGEGEKEKSRKGESLRALPNPSQSYPRACQTDISLP